MYRIKFFILFVAGIFCLASCSKDNGGDGLSSQLKECIATCTLEVVEVSYNSVILKVNNIDKLKQLGYSVYAYVNLSSNYTCTLSEDENGMFPCNGLSKNTSYTAQMQIYNNNEYAEGNKVSFSTKGYNIDLAHFYSYLPSNAYNLGNMIVAIEGAEFHVFASGFSTSNSKVEMVSRNEPKSRTLLSSTVISPSEITFKIPNDILSNDINTYEYYRDFSIEVNGHPIFSYGNMINERFEEPAYFHVYNDTPLINSVSKSSGTVTFGGYLYNLSFIDATPSFMGIPILPQSYTLIVKSGGMEVGRYTKSSMNLFANGSRVGYKFSLHHCSGFDVNSSLFPSRGVFSVCVELTMSNGSVLRTNEFEFTY